MAGERKLKESAKTPYEMLMRRIAAGILVAGLSASAAVFALAPAEAEGEQAGVYVASASNSKRVRLELERAGGKAAVFAAEFDEWFDGLWHGRRLAATLAVLSAGASLLCLLAGRLPPLDD